MLKIDEFALNRISGNEGIIYTNYSSFSEQDSNLRLAAFEDNLTIYNSIFISAEKYKTIFSAQNLSYYYDDMVFYKNEKTERFNNMKYSRVTSSDVFLSGNAPDNDVFFNSISCKAVSIFIASPSFLFLFIK